MRIGGFQKCSLIDYPGKICAIVFTAGCNFRCSYCHNPELVHSPLFPEPVPEEEIFSFLAKRKGKLDGVTITGGEPTLHADLPDFILKIKKMGFPVKLDSNGSNPDVLKTAIDSGAIDYIAMDVKAPLARYQKVANCSIDINKISQSIELIMNSNREYEFRTTITKNELDENDISEIGKLVKGARLCVLQKFVATEKSIPELTTYSEEEFKSFQSIMTGFVQRCMIR